MGGLIAIYNDIVSHLCLSWELPAIGCVGLGDFTISIWFKDWWKSILGSSSTKLDSKTPVKQPGGGNYLQIQ